MKIETLKKYWNGKLKCFHCGHIKYGIVPKPPWEKEKGFKGVECARCHQKTSFPENFNVSKKTIKKIINYTDLI